MSVGVAKEPRSQLVRVVDLCEAYVDCVNRTAPVVEGPTPFKMIRTTNVRGGFIDTDNVRYVSEETYVRWTRRLVPRRGDIVLTREAPLGDVGKVRTDEQIFLGQRLYHFRADPKKADADFLMYALMGPELQGQIRAFGSGATVEHLRLPDIENLEFHAPPLPEQQRVGGILSAYDNLIGNCEHRIQVLEAIARALYQEWFVTFRYPGHAEVPLVDSKLGRIPRGWIIRPLDDLIEFHIGGGWGTENKDTAHPDAGWVIRGTDIPDARWARVASVPLRYHTSSNISSRRLEPLDIVFETSGGSKGQPVGRALLVTEGLLRALPSSAICASFCKRIKAHSSLYDPYLLYLSLTDAYDSGEIATYQVQSTGISNFKWSEYLAGIVRAVPPKDVQTRFREFVAPCFDAISTLGTEAENLRKTRDLLLPRLLSGQLSMGSSP
jgi:type I restriction enzyme, S subunit